MDLSECMGTPNSEKKNLPVEQLDMSVVDAQNAEDMDVIKTAEDVWRSGLAFPYMYKSCEMYHTGDKWSMKIMLLTFANTRVLNSRGMHVNLTGKAGTGKSHVSGTVALHLPQNKVISGRFSDKSLFHKQGMQSGCVIIIDDQSLTDDLEEIFKEISSNFHKPYTYHSVGKDNKEVVHTIPAETVFWMFKVEMMGDEQTQDRQFILNTDDSPEQLDCIKDAIIADAIDPSIEADDFTQIVSRKLWDHVPTAYVSIPWARDIQNDERPEARNLNLLLDLIRASALLHEPLRDKGPDIKGKMNILAHWQDFMIAAKIMNRLLGGKGGSQKRKISQNGERLLDLLCKEYYSQPYDVPIQLKELRRKLCIDDATMSHILHGRTNRGTDGLTSKCPAIEVTNMNNPNHSGTGGTYSGKGLLWDYKAYLAWNGGSGMYYLRDEITPKCTSQTLIDMIADEYEEEIKSKQAEGTE